MSQLQDCVVVCCNVLQCVAVCCSALQCVAVCCSVLQCVAVCCSVLQCVAVRCSVLRCAAVCCSALQCAAVCCSVLQCVASRYIYQLIKISLLIESCVGCEKMHMRMHQNTHMGWLRLVGCLKLYVSFAKEPYKRHDILQKRPTILRSLLTVATP